MISSSTEKIEHSKTWIKPSQNRMREKHNQALMNLADAPVSFIFISICSWGWHLYPPGFVNTPKAAGLVQVHFLSKASNVLTQMRAAASSRKRVINSWKETSWKLLTQFLKWWSTHAVTFLLDLVPLKTLPWTSNRKVKAELSTSFLEHLSWLNGWKSVKTYTSLAQIQDIWGYFHIKRLLLPLFHPALAPFSVEEKQFLTVPAEALKSVSQ